MDHSKVEINVKGSEYPRILPFLGIDIRPSSRGKLKKGSILGLKVGSCQHEYGCEVKSSYYYLIQAADVDCLPLIKFLMDHSKVSRKAVS
jgi:hypothetical protein